MSKQKDNLNVLTFDVRKIKTRPQICSEHQQNPNKTRIQRTDPLRHHNSSSSVVFIVSNDPPSASTFLKERMNNTTGSQRGRKWLMFSCYAHTRSVPPDHNYRLQLLHCCRMSETRNRARSRCEVTCWRWGLWSHRCRSPPWFPLFPPAVVMVTLSYAAQRKEAFVTPFPSPASFPSSTRPEPGHTGGIKWE